MPIITKISTQKQKGARYNIFLDEQYAFSVDEDVLIRFQLKKGKQITDLEITQIQHADEIRKAFHVALRFLSFRMRSEQEIRSHLKKKDWDDSIIDAVLHQLRQEKLTDDLEFAKAYVRTAMNMGRKGPAVIQQELLKKGIKEPVLEAAMEEYTRDQQIANAIVLGNKFAKQHHKLSERMRKQKVEYALSTKGFPFEIINEAMNKIAIEKDEDEEWEAIVREGDKAKRRFSKFSGYEYKQRMKQALYRKGFAMDLIIRYVEKDAEDAENGE
ncbi:recombination regulator RecX [Siminovitchia sp. FSL H7-0308]|uniref:Regulatory protein RecX n=1 Tax=Siminovitchia thermophila TaxID=1245522 RepID=A0ABS2RBM5_9BACI|nr:recombination regulator RecX [Siminovitchia thermophila]MBM7717051.1 regulatory protein [Siminovitchia thermophila]ONK25152.1 recombination regulator RecX [Bacillus sp. VT-16-64]